MVTPQHLSPLAEHLSFIKDRELTAPSGLPLHSFPHLVFPLCYCSPPISGGCILKMPNHDADSPSVLIQRKEDRF